MLNCDYSSTNELNNEYIDVLRPSKANNTILFTRIGRNLDQKYFDAREVSLRGRISIVGALITGKLFHVVVWFSRTRSLS